MKAKDEEGNEMEITYSHKLQQKTVRTLQLIAVILSIFVALLMYVVFKLDQINAISALMGG